MEETSFGSTASMAPRTPRTPRRLQLPPPLPAPRPGFNRTFSLDPSVSSSRRSSSSSHCVTWAQPAALTVHAPSDFRQSLRTPSVYLKFVQMALTTACLALVADGYPLVMHNVAAVHFPFVVYSAYVVVTGVILLGYAIGMKMRELLMRIFGVLGAILFVISGCQGAQIALVYWADWQGRLDEGPTDEEEGEGDGTLDVESIPRRSACFAAQAALAFAVAGAHLADVVLSYCRTMALLN